MSTFVVTAYRWGQRNAHSYVVGAYPTKRQAVECAEQHVDYRGGKYACEVTEAREWTEESDRTAEQVDYVESPYYGKAGDAGHFHPADTKKHGYPCPKPFTVRELQNEIAQNKRDLAAAQGERAALDAECIKLEGKLAAVQGEVETQKTRGDCLQREVDRWTMWNMEQPWLAEIRGYSQQVASLTAELAALREDKARLDWLETPEASEWCFNASCADNEGFTFHRMTRAAIDAARAQEGKP